MRHMTIGLFATALLDAIMSNGPAAQPVSLAGLRIGDEIDPGVPWTVSLGERPLALALKSGNFGTDDFFLKAWSRLP